MNQSDISESSRNIPLRLFIAIACPPLSKIADLLKELKIIALQSNGEIRVVADSNLHITLKFLGASSPSSIASVTALLDDIAAHTPSFDIALTGAGIFKDAFWLGTSQCTTLTELATAIDQRLAPLGFALETRPFVPHLTVARINQQARTALHSWLQRCNTETWGNLHVREIHLYQSETLPTGVNYSILHTSRFNLSD